MLEAKIESGPKKSSVRLIPLVMSVMMGGTMLVAGYAVVLRPHYQSQDFLEKEVVTLEGTVIDERYVQPIAQDGWNTPSQYFFSIDRVGEGRIGIEVMESYNQKVRLESVDAKLERGTRVEVKARSVAFGEYKAFAHDVYVKR